MAIMAEGEEVVEGNGSGDNESNKKMADGSRSSPFFESPLIAACFPSLPNHLSDFGCGSCGFKVL